MKGLSRRLAVVFDPLVALGLGGLYVALLLLSVDDLGYARDEGFYFDAARSYQAWFELLLKDPDVALQRANLDRYWDANHLHPVLAKTLFALSHKYLHVDWQWFREAGTAFRFPGMVMGGIAVATLYAWGRRSAGRWAGLLAAVSFAAMPRIFYHAHLDCFDVPVAAMWLITTYVYFRSLRGGWGWAIGAGLLYGLLLNTKHNAWLLPPALIIHFLVVRGSGLWRELRVGWLSVPRALIFMATLGPLVFYATWPWIWHDTGKRLIEYVTFHMHHEYYNMEFLGYNYWKPPFPRSYAWLMTAGTVSATTLLLFLMGLALAVKNALTVRFRLVGERARALAQRFGIGSHCVLPVATSTQKKLFEEDFLWILCILTSYAPWLSKSTPIFGATKHWITAYPFMCLFAARAFVFLRANLAKRLPGPWPKQSAAVVLAFSLLAAPVTIGRDSHPWGLSAYTPLVGGASGAATLGLNRTFWGYTTGALQKEINQSASPHARIFLHDTAMPSFAMMVSDGRIRKDIRAAWNVDPSDLAIFHYEPHMNRIEYQIWGEYGTVRPHVVRTHHGVPVVWMYKRP